MSCCNKPVGIKFLIVIRSFNPEKFFRALAVIQIDIVLAIKILKFYMV